MEKKKLGNSYISQVVVQYLKSLKTCHFIIENKFGPVAPTSPVLFVCIFITINVFQTAPHSLKPSQLQTLSTLKGWNELIFIFYLLLVFCQSLWVNGSLIWTCGDCCQAVFEPE